MAKFTRDDLQEMIKSGVFDYGATMTLDDFLQLFDIERLSNEELEEHPISVVRKLITEENVKILQAIHGVRQSLIECGRYLITKNDIVRIALPSENEYYAEKYLAAGRKKLQKGERLLRKTRVSAQSVKTTASNIALAQNRIKILSTRRCEEDDRPAAAL